MKERDVIIDALPAEVFELGKKLPVEVRKQFVSLMEAWSIEPRILYNPKTRFIDYVVPGIIGLILQLLTVTLMACTIARERESGTLYQLMVTSLKRGEIVIGKILPYLAVSICLIAVITAVAGLHFHVHFYHPPALALICLLFLPLLARARSCSSRPFREHKRKPSSFPFSFCCRSLSFPAHSPRSSNCHKQSATSRKFFRSPISAAPFVS